MLKFHQLIFQWLVLFFIVLPCSLASAANPPKKVLKLSLKEAVVLSLRFNSSVQVEDLQRILDKFSLEVAKWQFDIQYSFTGAASYSHSVSAGTKSEGDSESLTPGVSLLIPLGTQFAVSMVNPLSHSVPGNYFYNPSLVFSATQPLLRGFGPDITLAPLHTAENQELINRLNLQNTVMGTITTVISQYISLVQAKYSIQVQKLSLQNSVDTLKQQQAFLKVGRIAPSDLVQFEASVASQKLALEQQEVVYIEQERQLLITLGIDPSLTLEVTKDAARLPTENIPTLAQSIDMALENNISYQQQLISFKNTLINLDVAADNQRPQLNFTATQTQGGGSGGPPNAGLDSLVNGRNANTTLGLSLTVPIDSLSTQQGYLQAKIGYKQAKINLEQAKRQVINDTINAYYVVINQKEQINQAKLSVQLAQQTLNIALQKLKYGKVSPFEASTLQTSLLSAQISYITTIAAYETNLAALDQILGYTLNRWHVQLAY